MAKQIRRFGRWMLVLGPLALLVFLLARPAHVQAATFSSPFWTNASSNLECACATSCSGCGGPSIWSPEGVNYACRHYLTILDSLRSVGTTARGLPLGRTVDLARALPPAGSMGSLWVANDRFAQRTGRLWSPGKQKGL